MYDNGGWFGPCVVMLPTLPGQSQENVFNIVTRPVTTSSHLGCHARGVMKYKY